VRSDDQLLRGLVEADDRPLRIVRPGVDLQHILHRGYESAARLGWNNPVLAAVGFKRVFLSVRWIVAGPLDDAEFDHLVLHKPQAPVRVTFRRL
jgi:hypothetical protein